MDLTAREDFQPDLVDSWINQRIHSIERASISADWQTYIEVLLPGAQYQDLDFFNNNTENLNNLILILSYQGTNSAIREAWWKMGK